MLPQFHLHKFGLFCSEAALFHTWNGRNDLLEAMNTIGNADALLASLPPPPESFLQKLQPALQTLKSDITVICVNILSPKWNGIKAQEMSEPERKVTRLWQSS